MKTKLVSLLCCFAFSIAGVFSQEKSTAKTDSFKVFGNCKMCKATIEGALKKKDGVLSKQWDKNSKMLSVTYDPSKITLQQIGKKVADAGYDNEYAKASDEKYNKLEHCCQYDRPKK